MKIKNTWLCFFIGLLGAITVGAETLTPIPLGDITAEGWLREQLARSRDGMGGHLDELEPTMLKTPYVTRETPAAWTYHGPGWSAEIAGNYWCGLVGLAYTLDDPALKAKAEKWVSAVLAGQEKDGYLGTYKPTDNRWEDFCAGGNSRGYLALLDYAEAAHRPDVAEAVHRALLWFCRNWAGDRKTDYAGVLISDPMLRCHKMIPDRRLVEFCLDYQRFFEKRDVFRASVKAMAASEFNYNQDHAVAYCNRMHVPAALYEATRDDFYLRAAETAYDKLAKYALHVTGAQAGNDEYLSPPHANGESEYCGFTDQVSAYSRLLAVSGETKWGDRMETTFFNAAQGARRKDEKGIQYFSSANAIFATPNSSNCCYFHNLYAPIHPVACCAVLSVKILPTFVRSLAMTDAQGGLVLTAYAPCRIRHRGCEIECRTLYPFGDTLEYVVHAKEPVRFTIRPKKPTWCDAMTVSVNGADGAATDRTWRDGDVLRVKLGMPPRLDRFDDRTGAMPLVVRRGPLCFSLPIREEWKSLGDGVPGLFNGCAMTSLPKGWSWWEVNPKFDVPEAARTRHGHGPYFKPWHIAIDERRTEMAVEMTGAKGYVWENPPVRLTLTGYHAPYVFAAYPNKTPPYFEGLQPVSHPERLTLVPYGCTALRLTYFARCDSSRLIPDNRPYFLSK